MVVKVRRCGDLLADSFPDQYEQLPLPSYQTPGSAGVDLRSLLNYVLGPGEVCEVPTGLALEIPEGYEGQVRSRSSLARRGLVVANSPGTVDSDYRGEVVVLIRNESHHDLCVERGDRVAQLVFCPVVRAELVEVDELTPTARGSGGFGSTGR